jgi:hypothetical protein
MMRAASVERLKREIGEDDLVLDVGGWMEPFNRADWVLDLGDYETRGRNGSQGGGEERFTADTWAQRDICDREPWPFEDKQFDFAICGHTLEDVRDPVWVCHELVRVAKRGYIEVPSRLEEHTYGVHGEWVGWGHHHWMVDVGEDRLDFVFKHHVIHRPGMNSFPSRFQANLTDENRAQAFWWDGSFEYGERVLLGWGELDRYYADFVNEHRPPRRPRLQKLLHRISNRIS